jgi:hypothetical protein
MPWVEQHEVVKKYIRKLNSRREYAAVEIYLFCDWAKLTPEQLLELKSDFRNFDAENLIGSFIIANLPFPDTRRWHIVNCVRAFFRRNSKRLDSEETSMECPLAKEHTPPSRMQRVKLFEAAYTLRDRVLIVLFCCTAMAIETVSKLQWLYFEENWQQQELPCINLPSTLLKGHGLGKYRGVRQITFLTPEAKQVLLEYRDWYTQTYGHQWSKDDYVLLQTKRNIGQALPRNEIFKMIIRIRRRAGVSFSSHDGRRIVQTALEDKGVVRNQIQKIKGRKVRGEDSPYSLHEIDKLRGKYRLVLPELEFLAKSQVKMADNEAQRLRSENDDLLIDRQTMKQQITIVLKENVALNQRVDDIDKKLAALQRGDKVL